jgi:replicative DNA helicase
MSFTYQFESSVIGGLILDASYADEVGGIVQVTDFSDHNLTVIYGAIMEMVNKNLKVDMLTLSEYITGKGGFDGEPFVAIAEIANQCLGTGNILTYARKVKEHSTQRKIAQLVRQFSSLSNQPDFNALEFLKVGLDTIENDVPVDVMDYTVMVDETVELINEHYHNPNKLTGVPTGFKQIDEMTNGLQKGNLIILAARPSMGKTLLALNVAENVFMRERLPVIFFSMEMTSHEIIRRSISRFGMVLADKVFDPKRLTELDWQKISGVAETLQASKQFFVNDKPGLTIPEIKAYCRKIQKQHGLALVVIDYLGLINAEGENETVKVGNISKGLKGLAKQFNVPFLVLSQLNRSNEARNDKRPTLSDIRQSGGVEQDADIVMLLYRDEYYHKDTHDKGIAELNMAKNRNGRTGIIRLRTNFDYFEFKDE